MRSVSRKHLLRIDIIDCRLNVLDWHYRKDRAEKLPISQDPVSVVVKFHHDENARLHQGIVESNILHSRWRYELLTRVRLTTKHKLALRGIQESLETLKVPISSQTGEVLRLDDWSSRIWIEFFITT